MAKKIATLLGVVFILVGIVGFLKHDLLGAHLSTLHNVVHLVSGALALYFGLKGTLAQAKMFCIIFGIVYGLLGVVGYLMGGEPDRTWRVIEGLTLGRMDHIIHILLGVLFLIGGFLTKADVSHATD
ncbi:MAG TPA: DUF4383 domain-containing protein [Blastocatellia bacterium]|nr:DUF4383 domain-containing protein [Blastocatellia bacterium]